MLNHLKKGDRIGNFSLASPTSVTAKKCYDRAKAYLENKGFTIVEGELTGKSEVYRAGTPKERAAELNALLRDPSITMIMSMIGGTNSNSMLPYLDYAQFARTPKLVVGYSDDTAILLALYAKTGISTFYGPALVPSFGEFPPLVDATYGYFERYFCEEVAPYTPTIPEVWSDEAVNWLDYDRPKALFKNEWVSIGQDIVEGRLIGGNNNAMYGIIGTPYFPDIRPGDILLIEDTMKSPAIVEKNLAMLKLHGVFDKVGGIILGKHEAYDDMGMGKQPLDLLREQLDGVSIPILAEVDCCHTHPMIPFAIGKKVRLNVADKTITCIENWIVNK